MALLQRKMVYVPCKYVVSNIDAKQLFLDLIDKKEINSVIVNAYQSTDSFSFDVYFVFRFK